MPDNPPQPVPGQTPVIPPLGLRTAMNFDIVRSFLFDRVALDNPLLMDLEFSDEEISKAQYLTTLAYNGMEPRVETLIPGVVPRDMEMIFLNGTASFLHQGKLMQLARNNLSYQAGNMEVDINAKRIETLTASAKMFREEFLRQAADRKRTINFNNAYGSY